MLLGEELRAEWAFRDAESGPEACQWGIGTSFGAQDVLAYTAVAHESGYVSGARVALPPAQGEYYVSLLMTNQAGLAAVYHVPQPLMVLACAEGATCPADMKCM